MAKSRAEKSEPEMGHESNSKKELSRRDFLKAGGAVIASAVLFNSLSSCTTSESIKSTATATTSTSGTVSALTPKYGGTLKYACADTGPGGWPVEAFPPSLGAQLCLEGLLHMDNKGKIIPWLADSYTVAEDLKSMTFNLKKGVRFHDGSDFNAEVAKWNLDNAIAAFPRMASVDIIDDYAIRVNFTEWSNLIWESFCEESYCNMISLASFQKNGKEWMRNHPVGTGPFKFASFQSEVSYKVVRNPDYWMRDEQGNQLPYLDAVEIIIIEDEFTMRMAFETREVDVISTPALSETAAKLRDQGYQVLTTIGSSYCFAGDTANADSPWANKKVREAFEYSLDREAIAQALSYGFGQTPYQIPGSGTTAYNPNFTLGRKYDPEKAKQLLAEAGYPDGFQTTMLSSSAGSGRDMAVAVQAYLAKININVQLELYGALAFDSIQKQASLHNGLAYFGFIDFPANFSNAVSLTLGPDAPLLKKWQRTDKFLELLNASLATPTPDVDLMRAVTDYLVEEALITPVMPYARYFAVHSYVMDGGWLERGLVTSWKPERAWLNK